MAIDDRDYMRQRGRNSRAGPTGRNDPKQALYSPKAYRGTHQTVHRGDNSTKWPRPPLWLWIGLTAFAITMFLIERRDRLAQSDASRSPATQVKQVPALRDTPIGHAPPTAPVPPRPTLQEPVARGAPDAAHRPTTPPAPPQDPWVSIYLCRSWQGAEFWSQQHCQQVQASILRIHRVSSALTWHSQLSIAMDERRRAEALVPPMR